MSARLPGSRPATDPERLLPRGRHDLSRETVARSQRDRLIDALAQTAAAKGYAGSSIADVCATAGVSTKAFYVHFVDKEACFLATYERGVNLVRRTMLEAYTRPGPWAKRTREGLELLLRTLSDQPTFARLAVVEVMAAGPRVLQRHRETLTQYRIFFTDAPRRAGWPEVPDEVVRAVIDGIHGRVHDYISQGRAAELPDLLPELTYFTLAPFVGPRTAATVAGLHSRPEPDDGPRPDPTPA